MVNVKAETHPSATRRHAVLFFCVSLLGGILFQVSEGLAQNAPESVTEPSSANTVHYIFMMDLSGSMTDDYGQRRNLRRTSTLADELVGARIYAEHEILASLEDAPDARVSFWSFGDMERDDGLVGEALNIRPDASHELLDLYFSSDREFDHDYTYLYYSIFEAVRQTLDLPDDYTPDQNLPDGHGWVEVLVFTDGEGDDVRDDSFGRTENPRYEAWLDRLSEQCEFRWRRWQIWNPEPPALPGFPNAVARAEPSWTRVGHPIEFDASASYDSQGQALEFRWDLGDGQTTSEPVVSHVYENPGAFLGTLQVTNEDGRTSEATLVVHVNPIYAPTAVISGPEFDYVNTEIAFDGSASTDDLGIVEWRWSFGDGGAGAGDRVTHVYSADSIGPIEVELAVRDEDGLESRATHSFIVLPERRVGEVPYRLVLGAPTDAYSADICAAFPEGGVIPHLANIDSSIRLVPEITVRSADEVAADQLIDCGRPDLNPNVPDSAARVFDVRPLIDWGPELAIDGDGGVAAQAAWSISAPERVVALRESEYTGVPPERFIPLTPISLELTGERPAVIRSRNLTPGSRYSIQFEAESLCRQLMETYPNSHFYLPGEIDVARPDSGATPSMRTLANIHVFCTARHVYELHSSVAPDAPASAPVTVDWIRQTHDPFQRTLYVTEQTTSGQGAGAELNVRVSVRHEDEPIDGFGFVELRGGDDQAGAVVRVELNDPVDVVIPSRTSSPLATFFHRGFIPASGDYEIVVCAQIASEDEGEEVAEFALECPECSDPFFDPDSRELCIAIPVQVKRTPLSVLQILIIVFLLWVAWRWWRRARFPKDLKLGDINLDRTHKRGLGGIWAQFWRKPVFLMFDADGAVFCLRTPVLASHPPQTYTVVAVRPLIKGKGMAIWLVVAANDPDDSIWEVQVSSRPGRALPVHKKRTEPTRIQHKELVQYRKLRSGGAVDISLHRQGPGAPKPWKYHFRM